MNQVDARSLPALLFALAVLPACGSDDKAATGEGGGVSLFALPDSLTALSEQTFFDHPWPSDFRRESDGTVRFVGYPNPRLQPILETYVEAMAGKLVGFSPAASGFVRFSVPLDEASLPEDPLATLEKGASAQLIDVDPGSPERGQRKRVMFHVRNQAGVYWLENTLSFMPALGFPLRPATRHAFVVTNAVRAKDGKKIGPARELQGLLASGPASGALATAREAYSEAIAELEAAGIGRDQIVQLAVFTTNDPAGEITAIRDWVMESYPAPDVIASSWSATDVVAGIYDSYEGSYGKSPDFQRGTLPFVKYGDGGELAFDASGVPELQREFDLRFAIAVPLATSCPMPGAGYPIALLAHGTGGNYRSMFGADDVAGALAANCIASMGIDQIFHGTRPGSETGTRVEILFFNFQNPIAARANGPESAIDVVQQARLFTETGVTVPASVSRTGSEIRFDAARVMFVGHSQGGVNGPIFLGIDDQTRGGVLSGSGSLLSISLLEKTKPSPAVAELVKSVFLGLRGEEAAELSVFHPEISLAQTIADPTDPIHYALRIVREPRQGFAPKSLLMTEGVNADFSGDSYTPPHTIEVQAVAVGLPPQNPVIHPVMELGYSDLEIVTIPSGGLSGNLASGKASGVLAQWPASDASDGHFVLFDIPEAMTQAAGFLRNLSDDPVGRVPAP